MKTILPALCALLLVAPLAWAVPDPLNQGVANACERSPNTGPCKVLKVPPPPPPPDEDENTTVGPGETTTYEGEHQEEGTVQVESGGTAVVDNATVTFGENSSGFVVKSGGTLVVENSTLQGEPGSCFGIDLEPGAVFKMHGSTIVGGCGVRDATEQAEIHASTFKEIPVALRLVDVSVVVEGNTFIDNTVAVNQTGGFPTLRGNVFQGGEHCVRDWLSDPTIEHNVFRGCHVGIWHERSESRLAFNDMSDDAFPPGIGILVKDTMSPTIEGNDISNYGTGILIVNARAYIRNNAIHGNVGDGVRIESNSAPMDIQGNLIAWNGRDGIRLVDAHSMLVADNNVTGNVGDGIRVVRGVDVELRDNLARANGGDGIVVLSDSLLLAGNVAEENAGDGIVLGGADLRLVGGRATGNEGAGVRLVEAARALLDGVNASGNLDGVRAEGGGAHTLVGVHASHNARDGFSWGAGAPSALSLTRAFENGRAGLIAEQGDAVVTRDAWWQGNAEAGVWNLDEATVLDARFSYWGSPAGPSTAAGGVAGDRVVGRVDFLPFLIFAPG